MRYTEDPFFWRAGAVATTLFMSVVLAALTIDTLRQITPGGARVPSYDVINSAVTYEYAPDRGEYARAELGQVHPEYFYFGEDAGADWPGCCRHLPGTKCGRHSG